MTRYRVGGNRQNVALTDEADIINRSLNRQHEHRLHMLTWNSGAFIQKGLTYPRVERDSRAEVEGSQQLLKD